MCVCINITSLRMYILHNLQFRTKHTKFFSSYFTIYHPCKQKQRNTFRDILFHNCILSSEYLYLHCIVYTGYSILYNVHCTMYNVHCTI